MNYDHPYNQLKYYGIELAKKFRLELDDKSIEEFFTDLEIFLSGDEPDDSLSLMLYKEFNNLFDHFRDGMLNDYKLPEIEFFLSEEENDAIKKIAKQVILN